ncbi:MAG: galactokinase [Microbacteriaceae bacterium]
MSDIRQDARAGFQAVFGRAAHGVWSAPGRVNLIGEHTDYNGGFVLPLAINRRTVVALGIRDDRTVRVASSYSGEVVEVGLAALSPEHLDGWAAYPLGVAWALGDLGADLAAVPGFDAYIDSSVPIGAGLSSSAAIECAVAVALNEVWRLGLDWQSLARAGQRAENEAVGAPTGIMDQSASLLGRQDAAVFLDCRSMRSEIVPLGFAAAGLELLIIDTGVGHEHATGQYAARRASCAAGARRLEVTSLREIGVADLARARTVLDPETFRRVRHVVTENQRVRDTVEMLRTSGPTGIGDLLDASHRSMRDDFEISVPELDLAVETAQNAGALGARMTGGGFGGSAIALVPIDARSRVQVAIDGAFAEHAYAQPDMFVVRASQSAGREP